MTTNDLLLDFPQFQELEVFSVFQLQDILKDVFDKTLEKLDSLKSFANDLGIHISNYDSEAYWKVLTERFPILKLLWCTYGQNISYSSISNLANDLKDYKRYILLASEYVVSFNDEERTIIAKYVPIYNFHTLVDLLGLSVIKRKKINGFYYKLTFSEESYNKVKTLLFLKTQEKWDITDTILSYISKESVEEGLVFMKEKILCKLKLTSKKELIKNIKGDYELYIQPLISYIANKDYKLEIYYHKEQMYNKVVICQILFSIFDNIIAEEEQQLN